MKPSYPILAIAVILFSTLSLSAAPPREQTVDSIQALVNAVTRAEPGDVLVLKDGLYKASSTLRGKGTAQKPIVIRAESIGGVRLDEALTLRGEYLSLVGFRFGGRGNVNIAKSRGCRVSQCHFSNIQHGKWLMVDQKSRQIELDHCLFERKENNKTLDRGCQLVQFRLSNTGEAHHIHHNYFRDIPKGKNGNGYETLQLITHGNPKDPKGAGTGNIIEMNLFERCDGEAEIISVKSNGNLLRKNTFLNCRGALVLRQGHRNVVNGNWFLGGSGGVRLQGRGQVVINNYCRDLTSFGLAMMNGIEAEGKPFYVRVERALVAHNTFINCKKTFYIGMDHSKYPPGRPPLKCTIANNLLCLTKEGAGDLITFINNKQPVEWTWVGNVFAGRLGIPERKGLREADPALQPDERGFPLPTAATPTTDGKLIEQKELETDLFGNSRPKQATVGAVQYRKNTTTGHPLGAKDVGPSVDVRGAQQSPAGDVLKAAPKE